VRLLRVYASARSFTGYLRLASEFRSFHPKQPGQVLRLKLVTACLQWYNSIMSKPRGNPNWCQPQPPSAYAATASEFELQTKKLALRPDEYVDSEALKEWARRNKDHKFVPSELLQAWGFNS